MALPQTKTREQQARMSDDQIRRDYPVLLAVMEVQLGLTLDQTISGMAIGVSDVELLAVAATRVAVEVCPHCREQQVPCNCWRDE